ncbi:hypothetical protein KPY62_02965, partial [Psychrobacter sp. TAE2020]|uniref:calcium-binding protein n=1 Tax=Psychrobacter sp. TAE2020 TaxID=2846762 RepID=UPI001C0F78B0
GLTISAGGGTILLSNQFNQWGVDNIYFDDGTVWDRATIEAMADGGSISGRSVMSFDVAEEFNTQIDIFANSQQVELPNIYDLFDLSSNELAFESADVVGADIANYTNTSVPSGDSEPSTVVDLTIGQLPAINDNMQTEVMFHIM